MLRSVNVDIFNVKHCLGELVGVLGTVLGSNSCGGGNLAINEKMFVLKSKLHVGALNEQTLIYFVLGSCVKLQGQFWGPNRGKFDIMIKNFCF